MLNPAYMYIVASIGKENYEKLKYDHAYYHIHMLQFFLMEGRQSRL